MEKRKIDKISIIVPTYKEGENIEPLLSRISKSFETIDKQFEVIIVDDDSRDRTEKMVNEHIEKGFPVRMIIRRNERGLSSAVIKGFQSSKDADLLVCMDADLSHPPERLNDMILAFEKDPLVEFVIGSRYVPGASTDKSWSIFRWLNSKFATILARPFTDIKDPMSGFFAIPRNVFDRSGELNPIGYKIGLELIVKSDCKKVKEIPIHFSDRQYGESKLSFREQLNYIRHLKRLADYKFGVFSRLAQFCFVGGTGMIIDLVIYGLLIHYRQRMDVARGMAILVAMTWNFGLNRRITFNYSRYGNIITQYLRFVATCALGASINWTISIHIGSLLPFFYGHPLISAFIGIVVGTMSNFLFSRNWVFKQ